MIIVKLNKFIKVLDYIVKVFGIIFIIMFISGKLEHNTFYFGGSLIMFILMIIVMINQTIEYKRSKTEN